MKLDTYIGTSKQITGSKAMNEEGMKHQCFIELLLQLFFGIKHLKGS
jgi:hypothetical protein